MQLDVLLGLQWGDEGKGKLVDVFTEKYPIVARFQGGPNAGHTLIFDGNKFVLHTIPSGIFRKHAKNLIGNGVVVDPTILFAEIDKIKDYATLDNLYISDRAHLILPTHRMIDKASELAKGKLKIGSTLKGIGPCYMDRTGRNGLRVGDVISSNFEQKYKQLKEKHLQILQNYKFDEDFSAEEAIWMESITKLKQLNIVRCEDVLDVEQNDLKALAEGAQGTLLDINYGSYPYVTSSDTNTAGACTGLGVSPKSIGEVFGVFKAYCTRVGSGPFPTELFDVDGERMAKVGHEFGATTGRPRRCGWLDLTLLKYAVQLNGCTQLAMMKADVLSGFETLKVCVGYQKDGVAFDSIPFDLEDQSIEPIYKELKGWNEDLTSMNSVNQLPQSLLDYMAFIEQFVGVPIQIVSVGPDREQTIFVD